MKGGKSFNDLKKSADVRNKVLDAMLLVYAGKENQLTQKQWELTLRMGTTVLPRLNEVSGPDGTQVPLVVRFIDAASNGNSTGIQTTL